MDRKISELDQVLNLDEQAEFPLSQDNGGTPTTFKAKLTQLAAKIAEAITFSNLITNDKHIIGAINEAAQGSGASMKFEDLSDVDINNLQDGQFSKYDSTTEKWKNTTIQESDVANLASDLANKADKTDLVYEKTASGSIATFTDGGDDIPVSEYECEIVAQQASGTPTPVSPLPISGFSQADIPVSGKNLVNLPNESFTANLNTNKILGDIYLKAGTYTWSYTLSTNLVVTRNRPFYYINGSNVYAPVDVTTSGRNSWTFTLAKDATIGLRWWVVDNNNAFNLTDFQLEKSNQATTYEAYKGNTYLVEFGQTIYGGRLIYKNGQWSIEATHGSVDLSSLTWTKSDNNFFAELPEPIKRTSSASETANISCEIFATAPQTTYTQNNNQITYYYTGSTETLSKIIIFSTDYADLSSFETAIIGYKMMWELATPVIIPITSSTRIKTISGVNNIFSNTGDNSVKYFTENADEIAELVKAEIASTNADYHEYSTTEHIVGKWIDGKTLYEISLETTKTFTKNAWTDITDLSALNIDKIIDSSSWFTYENGAQQIDSSYLSLTYLASTGMLQGIQKVSTASNVEGTVLITIRYTKTTSNTRSLNLSKGVEEKTEEIKTEEVKEEEKNAEQNER